MLKTAYQIGVELALKEAGINSQEDWDKLAAIISSQAAAKALKNIAPKLKNNKSSWWKNLFGSGKGPSIQAGTKPTGWKPKSKPSGVYAYGS